MSRRSRVERADTPIRVMIVEPRALLGAAVQGVFDEAPDIAVVAHVRSPDEALQMVRDTAPDVIVLDSPASDPQAVEATRRLRRETPDPAIIVLGGEDDDTSILTAVEIGAVAHLAEVAGSDDLVHLVRRVARGARPLTDEVSTRPDLVGPILDTIRKSLVSDRPAVNPLTSREMEVLRLVADGLRNREIAERLGVSSQTVKNHLSTIIYKLGVQNRTRAVTYAARQGWLRLGESADTGQ